MNALLLLTTLFLLAPDNVQFNLKVKQAQSPPVIDGAVKKMEWQNAAVADNFIQYEPRRGEPSETATRAMVMYDSAHIYVAFQVSDPETPTAQLTRRDADLFDDDAVILLLDTHNDHRSAYYFMTNVLGTQTDGRVVNDGRTVDATWDAPWQCAARRTETGWTVEMSIPLTSIKYAASKNQTWGINFGRCRRRTLEVSFWAGPLDNRFRVSQAGTLAGLNIPSPIRRHQIITYGLSRIQEKEPNDWDAGVDFRYALTPEMSAYATITKDLFLRVFFQTNSVIDRKNLQAVCVYRYKPPFGTIQLAFQRGTAEFGERSTQGNTLFLKVTGVF